MVDVGGHVGETLAEVVDQRWGFDLIFVFEPAIGCREPLARLADERVHLVMAGWWDADAEMDLHDPGLIGASVARDKALTGEVERCAFIDAATWMQSHLEPGDEVWLKLNCEGAECVVLDHLDEERMLGWIDHLLVHFDVEKIPSLAAQAIETRHRLDAAGLEWIEARDIMFGRSHRKKTANWLAWTQASKLRRVRYAHVARWEFRARQFVYPLKQRVLSHQETS
jgi:hypothetical protein